MCLSELGQCLEQVLLGHTVLAFHIEVFEKRDHLLKVGIIEHDGFNGCQELLEVDVFLFFLVNDLYQPIQNLCRVVDTKHLGQLDEVVALDAAIVKALCTRSTRRRVVLLDHSVRLKDVVAEALGIVLVERDQPVGLEYIRIQNVNLLPIRRRHHVGGGVLRLSLLDAAEVLGHEEDRIGRSILEQRGDGVTQLAVHVLLL